MNRIGEPETADSMNRTRYFTALSLLLVIVAMGCMLAGLFLPGTLILAAIVLLGLATAWMNHHF